MLKSFEQLAGGISEIHQRFGLIRQSILYYFQYKRGILERYPVKYMTTMGV